MTSPTTAHLHKKVFVFMNTKGGAGKTTLAANLAASAAVARRWRVLALDLDASSPMTTAGLGYKHGRPTIQDTLNELRHGGSIEHTITYVPDFGFHLIPGAPAATYSAEELELLPQLIADLRGLYFDGGYADLIVVDVPGENKALNAAVGLVADMVALPMSASATELYASTVAMQLITQLVNHRQGGLEFAGLVPNRIKRNGKLERDFFAEIQGLGRRILLPYIPESELLRGTMSRESSGGQILPVMFSPNATATQRLVYLFEQLDLPPEKRAYPEYEREFMEFIGMATAKAQE
jgi:cellulose biosynthesis protein BcsQ